MKLSGAQIIVEELCKHNVSTVFGYPGGAVLPLYDELYKNSGRITHIISAHEQGAVHAADGYARACKKTGVVISTSGPGATNLVTGIANAYLDSVPIVAITGNVSVSLLGKNSFQEVDIVGITKPVVKANFLVTDIKDLAETIRKAFRIAKSGRPGPVLIDVPKNIQTSLTDYSDDNYREETESKNNFDVSAALEALKKSKKPFIYAGGGIISSGAEEELLSLSQKLSAPIGFSMMGLTAVSADYSLNLGMCGMHGLYASTVAQSECDLMLAVGVRFSDRATGDVNEFGKGKTIIHIDIDPSEFGKNIASHIDICGDLKDILKELAEKLLAFENPLWLNRIEELKKMNLSGDRQAFSPQNIIEAANSCFDDDTVVSTDVGQHQMWTVQYYKFRKPRTLLTSGGLGTMGYGFGAAIGGCIANGRKRTLFITSDGSFGMNLNELATAVSQRLPITILLLNNGVLGMVRQWQTMFYGERYSQTTLNRKTDFEAVAKAFGADSCTVSNLSELNSAFKNLKPNTPTLINCIIDKDEMVLPMIPPGGTVNDIISEYR